MSFSSNSTPEMGRTNREKTPRDGSKSEPNVDSNEEGPIDLSMPRYPNRGKDSRASNSYFAAGRNKQSSTYDVDDNKQPINYSKKYVESNSLSAIKTNYVPRNSLSKVKADQRQREKGFSQQEGKNDPYGDYAETDLDQPTDYSLRYAEDDTDDEEKQNNAYFPGNEQEDTVKTYCIEGTPYETPFNVSSATSMSDLRLQDAKEVDGSRKNTRKVIQDSRNTKDPTMKEPTSECTGEDNKDRKNVEEESEILIKDEKNMTNELVLNSSSASIEKPINYYDEGTPGRISRVSSLSSLGCANGTRNEEIPERIVVQTTPALPVSPITPVEGSREETDDTESPMVVGAGLINDEEAAVSGPEEEKGDVRVVDKEGKVVTFGGEDHYAEQTPLMFSRSSSLGSLSGFEQHSIHDDRSSIVSDFSRRTSGAVSPSELPDSPTQTVPPSPRHNQKNNTSDFSNRAPPLRQFSYVKSPRSKSSVFEDNVTAFKEESTPIEFSAATSLSSLTIDDEPKIMMETKEKDYPEKARTVGRFLVYTNDETVNAEVEKVENEKEETQCRENDRTDQEQVSDGNEDDEDILAVCISMGMRNSMRCCVRQSFKKCSEIPEKVANEITTGDSTTNLVRYETSSTLDRLVADVAAVSLSTKSTTKNSIDVVAVPPDTVCVYCTEDTPASISPVGSQSNLLALSILSISGEIEEDEINRLSEGDDDEKILNDCKRSGTPTTLQETNSYSGTEAVRESNSPHRASSNPEVYVPGSVDTREAVSMPSPSSAKSNELPTECTSSANSIAVDHDTSGDDDKLLGDCIRAGMPKPLQETFSFSGTTAVTKHQSPHHATTTKQSDVYLPRTVDTRQAVSISLPSPAKNNDVSVHRESSEVPNSTPVDHDTSGDDDKLLGDCIRAGMPRGLQGTYSFSGAAVVPKLQSPRHVSSTKQSNVYLSRSVDARQAVPMSSTSPAKIEDVPVRRPSSATSNSTIVDHDLSGDDDKILGDCIRAGMPRGLQGTYSFPGAAVGPKFHSPRQGSSTKKSQGYLPRPVDNPQAVPMSSPPHAKSNDSSVRRTSSTRSNSTAIDHDTSVDDDKLLDDCIRAGMPKGLQETYAFPGPTAVTKLHSPREPFSTKTFYDDKILDDCIRSGIARTLRGTNTFSGTAAVTKFHSPRHASSTRKSEAYLPKPVDTRQAFSTSLSSPVKNHDVPTRRTSSPRSNPTSVDSDRVPYYDSPNHSDDEAIRTRCIQSAMPKACRSSLSFAKPQASRKASKSQSRNATLNEAHSCSSTRVTTEIFRTSVTRVLIPATNRAEETFGDNSSLSEDEEDLILAQCIRSGMPKVRMPKGTNYQRAERRSREQ